MRTITYNQETQEFRVKFEYNAKLISDIKKHFSTRTYDATTKSWVIPVKDSNGYFQGTLYNYVNRENFAVDAETEKALEATYFGRKEFFKTV